VSQDNLTELLYLNDHYAKEFDAIVDKVVSDRSLILNKTLIYARGGGQPSDHAWITAKSSSGKQKLETKDSQKTLEGVVHELTTEISTSLQRELIGSQVHGVLDWDLRYKHMRHHTALHILSGVVYHKYQAKITGGQIYQDRARLDLSLDDLSKERKSEIETEMNRIISQDLPVKTFWIDSEEALKKSELYRLSADLLPKGQDKLRIVDIVGFDAQLDGGTHVARTGEIGRIRISKSENKGKDNKRIEIVLEN
jgi:misacylated tRNA(Ala) deacylase